MTHPNLVEWLISFPNALLPSNLHHLWGCGHEPRRHSDLFLRSQKKIDTISIPTFRHMLGPLVAVSEY